MLAEYNSSTTLIFLDPSVRTFLIHDIIRNPIRAILRSGIQGGYPNGGTPSLR